MRTLASVPFGGRYRLIDFVLSNMVNSGITNIGIIAKYNYQSLMDHVQSGKNWGLARKNGGLTILPPFNDVSGGGVFNNRFEAIKSVESFIRHNEADYVVMSDCDIVCNFDFAAAMVYTRKRARTSRWSAARKRWRNRTSTAWSWKRTRTAGWSRPA